MSQRSEPVSESSTSPEVDPQWRKYVDNPGLVLLSCFFVFAIFGLPLIFMCRKFSPAMKIFWSIVVTLYTAFLLACFAGIMYWCWLQITSAFG